MARPNTMIIRSGGEITTIVDRTYSLDSTVSPVDPLAFKFVNGDAAETLYCTQPALRTVVDFLATNIAQVPLHAYERAADDDRERITAGPIADLLRNPSRRTTAYEFSANMVYDLALQNRYCAQKFTERDGTRQLVRIPPTRWRFVRDSMDRPTHIEATRPDGSTFAMSLNDVLWIDGYPVDSSPVDTLRDILGEEAQAAEYRRQLWANGGRFGRYLYSPTDAPKLGTTGRTNLRTQIERWESSGDMAGKVPVLEEGREFRDLKPGITPEAGQQVEARKLARAEVAAAYQVPPVLVGLLDGANYSNVTAYREIVYSDTLGPWFRRIQDAFNARVVPWLSTDDSTYVEFNVQEKLRLAFEDQARILQTMVGGPFMLRNEARKRLNMSSIEGGDDLITPLNVLVGGQASPTDSGSQNEGN